MDVRCERCGTEYEFDDALVSGRGTTVKCTNCGHKFKIRRSDGDYSEDFWNVRTGDGRTLVFTSLRELQRAIQAHQVDRTDMLSRGGLPPKAIGGIPELAPFFDQRDAKDAQGAKGGTLPPAPPRLEPSPHDPSRRSRPPPPPGAVGPALAPPRQRLSTRPEFPAPPPVLSAAATRTLPGTGSADDVPAPFEGMRQRMGSVPPRDAEPTPPAASATPARQDFGKTQPLPPHMRMAPTLPGVAPPGEGAPRPSHPPPLPAAARSAPPPAGARSASAPMQSAPPVAARAPHAPPPMAHAHEAPAERPSDPALGPASDRVASAASPSDRRVPLARAASVASARRGSDPDPTPDTTPLRRIIVEDDAHDAHDGRRSVSDLSGTLERRRSVGGYVVAVVVVLAVGVVGAFWAKNNLGALVGPKPVASAPMDPRVASFLSTGEQALAEGNTDFAKESFDKASALAERDPHVMLDVARLAAARADVLWLKSRLLPTDAADEHRLVRDGLAEQSQAARRAADDALAAGPEDAAALRAKIDALRISGDRDGARALVAKLGGGAPSPETAYVLAALDLADPEPLWPSVVERLRSAAAAESGPGRARAALVYALARSGDAAGAKSEVDRLAGMARQHPLLPQLRAFADRAKTPVAAAKADAGAALAAHSGNMPPSGGGAPVGGGGGPSGDPRVLVAQAETARNKRDYERARMLYSAALDKNPNDSEALHGLAAIAHAQHDLAGARASYKRVLAINPTYLPALVGVADVDWESGDKASATKTYKEIVDRFPEGAYPGYVKQRVEAGSAPAPASGSGGGG